MTGYAARTGALAPFSWSWELRAVNGRGLDLRLRVPDMVPGLEAALRARLGKALGRGSVTLNLRLARDEAGQGAKPDAAAIDALLEAIKAVEQAAGAAQVALAPTSALDILRHADGVKSRADQDDYPALKAALQADFETLLTEFLAFRVTEGAALSRVLSQQLEGIDALVGAAEQAAADRSQATADRLQRDLTAVMDTAEAADPARVAQELALIAVKADITEELDRLRAHVEAARALLATPGPIGRKFDFLTQEFNREANTLCAKSGARALTRVGLDLKTLIDQMREQVQNVE